VHDSDHDDVDITFMDLSWGLYCPQRSDWALKQWWTTWRQKGT